jgi:hypothetical protein
MNSTLKTPEFKSEKKKQNGSTKIRMSFSLNSGERRKTSL